MSSNPSASLATGNSLSYNTPYIILNICFSNADLPKKRPRKPPGDITRRSSRVVVPAVSINDNAKSSANPLPKPRDLKLLHKVFADDEDSSKLFYVTDVKYYDSFETVCCFCVPYHGDVTAAEQSAVDLHKSSNVDDYIYDCAFVRNNVV